MMKKVDVMAAKKWRGNTIPSMFVSFEVFMQEVSVPFLTTGISPMARPRSICSIAKEKNKIPSAKTARNTWISEKIRRTIVTYLHTTRVTRSSAN